jgi:hypothetical protein
MEIRATSPKREGVEPAVERRGLGALRALSLSPPSWVAVAACTLGVGLSFGDGHLDPGGVTFLVLTWAALIAAFTSRTAEDPRQLERVLEVGVVVQFVMLVAKPPGGHLLPALQEHTFLAPVFPAACMLMAMLAATMVIQRPLLGRATFPAVLALFGIAAAWMLPASPHPPIDVIDFARESAEALAHGHNPYDLHFRNLYGDTKFFGPGFATNETIDVGLVYPPLSLLLTAAGEYLFGDSRATLVVAVVLTAILLDRLGGRPARLAALLFVSTPRQYFVLEHGWTEPIFVCGFALLLLLASRRSAWTAVGLAALLALKQFAVLFLPLTPLLAGDLRPRRSVGLVVGALLGAGLLVAPFFLWDPLAYVRSTVLFHLAQPFRPDSLNFAALWAWARGGAPPPTTVPTLVCLAAAMVVALRGRRPTPSGFAAGCALVLLATLAWSKQAHCNYLYLVVGLLLCSVAATAPRLSGPDEGAGARQVPFRGGVRHG